MKYIIVTAAAAAILSACSVDQSKADLAEPETVEDIQPESYVATVPDKIEIISNVDKHPTIVRLCIDGTAWRTISTSHSGLASPAIERVSEWDEWCEQ